MDNDLSVIFARNMRLLLELKQEDTVSAAKKAHINQKTVWNYTQPEHCNPTLTKVGALAKALRVHPSLMMIDSAFDNGLPETEALDLVQTILQLDPRVRAQVMEFIAMWKRPGDTP